MKSNSKKSETLVAEQQQQQDKKLRHSSRLCPDDPYKSRHVSKEVSVCHQGAATSDSLFKKSMSMPNKTNQQVQSRRSRTGPAELFRTDFITAMKLPDAEVLNEYFLIADQWKMDWEKGVQVPVKDTKLYSPNTCVNPYTTYEEQTQWSNEGGGSSSSSSFTTSSQEYEMPSKYVCSIEDAQFNSAEHEPYELMNRTALASESKYDYDQSDANWLMLINREFQLMGEERLERNQLETLIQMLETKSNDYLKRFHDKLKNYNIEYDEAIVCDVCRSPDSETNNEMVFCDGCNICVHQACYGIESIPQGSWLCGPCSFGGCSFKPECLLCSYRGTAAMKPTRNCRNWCHVSCALWVPETGFGNPAKLEPIVNINKIAAARWELLCCLCNKPTGCCIECSEKKCEAAFHITCAFKHNLCTEQVISNGQVVSRCYCLQHSKLKTNWTSETAADNVETSPHSRHELNSSDEVDEENFEDEAEERKYLAALQSMTETERKVAIVNRLEKIYSKFWKSIDLNEVKAQTDIKSLVHLSFVFNYWKMKRRFNRPSNKALMYPQSVDDLINQTEHLLTVRMKMFTHLRHDLERLRNLCYLVTRREKQKRQYYELNQHCFQKQVEYLNKYKSNTDNPYQMTAVSPFIVPASSSSSSLTSLLSPPRNNSLNSTSLLSSTPQPTYRTTYRIRDILQIKNEHCIYDFPEKWTVSADNVEPELSLSKKDETSPTIDCAARTSTDLDSKKKLIKRDLILTDSKEDEKCKNPHLNRSLFANSLSKFNKNVSSIDRDKTQAAERPLNDITEIKKTDIKDISINILNNRHAKLKREDDVASSASGASSSVSDNAQQLANSSLSNSNGVNCLKAVSVPLKRLNDQNLNLIEFNKEKKQISVPAVELKSPKRVRLTKHHQEASPQASNSLYLYSTPKQSLTKNLRQRKNSN